MIGPCIQCLFWKEAKERPGERVCRKNPPTPVLVPQPSHLNPQQMNLVIMAVDPPTNPDHECGCWEDCGEVREIIEDNKTGRKNVISIGNRKRSE